MTKFTQMSADNDPNAGPDGQKGRRIHLREISGDSESPLETVGQDLRAARLRRGDEIAQVSRALKIRKDHLDALENDRLEDLPGKTYAIGFVRSYARHLGLDSAQYVERFKRDISGRHEEEAGEPAPIHQDEQRRLPQGWRVIAGVVVLLLGYGAWHLLSSGGDSSQPVPPPPNLNPPRHVAAAKPAPVPVAPPVQSATPSPATDAVPATATDQATATPPPAQGPASPATRLPPAKPAAATATASAAPNRLLPSGPAPAVPAVASAQANSAPQVIGTQNAHARVILRARGDTVVTVKSPDGGTVLNRALKAGDVYQAPNTPGLSLATSDGGALEIDVDGVSLGRAGQTQQVLGHVSLDPQSLTDRFNGR
jgi:cytoskeleton protein RodZ